MEHALPPPKGFDGADNETYNPHTFTQRCNFKNDCPKDGADEEGCPQFYSFENCASPEACGWAAKNVSKELEWVVATGEQVSRCGKLYLYLRLDYLNKATGSRSFEAKPA